MQVENEFTAALAGLFGPNAVQPNEAGEYVFRFAGTPLKMICRPEAQGDVYCYAKIGTLKGYLAAFVDKVLTWRGHIDEYRKAVAEAGAEDGKEVRK